MNFSEYSDYLQTRSLKSIAYKKIFLYPKLMRYLAAPSADIGCGIGDFLTHHGNSVGYDINQHLVDYCRERGLKAEKMLPNVLPILDNSQSSVLLDNVLEHIADPNQLLSEIHRVLVDNGTFVVGVPGMLAYTKDLDHKIFYTPESLIERISNSGNFAIVALLHIPFKSDFLNTRFSAYSYYGVFRKIKPNP